MKIFIIVVTTFIISLNNIFAQRNNKLANCGAFKPNRQTSFLPYFTQASSLNNKGTELKRNLLFLELAGNGGVISLNYERYFTNKLSFRVGLGNDINTGRFYPMLINYTSKFHLEIGAGIVPYSFDGKARIAEEIFADKTSGTLITFLCGFKKIYNSFLLKISFTPFYNTVNAHTLLFAGLSLGYAF